MKIQYRKILGVPVIEAPRSTSLQQKIFGNESHIQNPSSLTNCSVNAPGEMSPRH
jgi:hypothetical protein